MLQEFRDFIAKGNVMDMAVGIIIGASFTAIVASMVGDLINPILGLITGGIDFSNHFFVLKGDGTYATLQAAREGGASVFAWGSFFTAVINFLIIAFVVFLLVKWVNAIKKRALRESEASAAGPSTEALLADIRDILVTGAPSQTAMRAAGAEFVPDVTPVRPPA